LRDVTITDGMAAVSDAAAAWFSDAADAALGGTVCAPARDGSVAAKAARTALQQRVRANLGDDFMIAPGIGGMDTM
jgi:hypothetical protein